MACQPTYRLTRELMIMTIQARGTASGESVPKILIQILTTKKHSPRTCAPAARETSRQSALLRNHVHRRARQHGKGNSADAASPQGAGPGVPAVRWIWSRCHQKSCGLRPIYICMCRTMGSAAWPSLKSPCPMEVL